MSTNLLSMQSLAPGSDLDAYLQTVSNFPILTVDEERELADLFYYENDLEAARKLVMCHLRFVAHIARSYRGYGLPEADLIQEGNVGLMKAVKRYNPEVGVRLVSFAVHWIKAEMHEFILRNWRMVKIATTKAQRKLFFNLRGSKKRLAWLTSAETKAVAKDLGVTPAEVSQMEGRLASADMAFDGYGSDDEDAPSAPVYFLANDGIDPAEEVARNEIQARESRGLIAGLSTLDERSREIIEQRWLTDDKATLHELAARYEVSAERIRQIEKTALKKLKTSFAS